ncbi:MAG: CRTAC1 family protein [Acidobacteriota bacterium]
MHPEHRLRRLLTIGGLACSAASASERGVEFFDRSVEAGLDLVTYSGSIEKPHILESTGNGVLVLDFDRDGYEDLYFSAAYRLPADEADPDPASGRLYRNLGNGRFVARTREAEMIIHMYGHGGCVGDANGDGLPDLYLTAFGPNVLLINEGDGTFTDVTAEAEVGDSGWSIGATFFDADGDGDEDLFVGNYITATWGDVAAARRTRRWRGRVDVMDGPKGLPASSNTLYRNLGDGRFQDVTEESGLGAPDRGYSMAVGSLDFDNDGDLDLYVANDSTANRLYRNDGSGRFEEIGTWIGAAYNADGREQGSMGLGFGDYDGDGWLDLAVTNFAHDYYTLYRNQAGEFFLDQSFVVGLAGSTFAPLGWAALFVDVDLDRDLDLFFANGHIYPQVDSDPALHESYRQRNMLLLNEDGQFRDGSIDAGPGFLVRESSRGAALFDLDNDGHLEIAISNQDASPTLLVDEADSERHWSVIELAPLESGRSLLGSKVVVIGGGVPQHRQVLSGASYASQSSMRSHFGLAASEIVDSIDITWPDGIRQRLLDVPIDRIVVVARPSGGAASQRRELEP